jgi:hypothetical protein
MYMFDPYRIFLVVGIMLAQVSLPRGYVCTIDGTISVQWCKEVYFEKYGIVLPDNP